MSAGAIFGVVTGSFISIVASNVGNILAFWAGRYLFRDVVVAYLSGKFPKWALLNAVLSGPESFRLIVLLRLSPIAPWYVLTRHVLHASLLARSCAHGPALFPPALARQERSELPPVDHECHVSNICDGFISGHRAISCPVRTF
jgi:hypothetical protein